MKKKILILIFICFETLINRLLWKIIDFNLEMDKVIHELLSLLISSRNYDIFLITLINCNIVDETE